MLIEKISKSTHKINVVDLFNIGERLEITPMELMTKVMELLDCVYRKELLNSEEFQNLSSHLAILVDRLLDHISIKNFEPRPVESVLLPVKLKSLVEKLSEDKKEKFFFLFLRASPIKETGIHDVEG